MIDERLRAKIATEQTQRYAAERADWIERLNPSDWLLDGHRISSKTMLECWHGLDWSSAWMDMGPSPAGNLGPYWHVPLPSEDTVHRLYPNLSDRWLLTVRQAVAEALAKAPADD